MTHTDIKKNSKLIGIFPDHLQPFALLARLDRPVGICLLALPGWWAITLASGGLLNMGIAQWTVFILFGIGAVLMRSAGCVINDIWDRKLDAKVERTKDRPLASGEVSVYEALIFLSLLLFLGFALLLLFNAPTIALGFLVMPLIIAYPFMKRLTNWPQAFLGLAFNFGVLMGWSAITGEISLAACLLYVSCFFWTLGYDTVYAFQDREDDSLIGVKSTALYLGDRAPLWIKAFYAISFLTLNMAAFLPSYNILMPLILLPAGGHLIWQMIRWDMHDQESSLSVFKSNTHYGFLVLTLLMIGASLYR